MANKKSPLLLKAEAAEKKRRFNIPKKGRIRIILILTVLGILIAALTGNNEKSSVEVNGDKEIKENAPDTYENKKVGQKKEKEERDKRKKQDQGLLKTVINKITPERKLDLNSEKLRTIFREKEFPLNRKVAKFRYKGKRLQAHSTIDTASVKRSQRYFRRYHPRYGAAVLLEIETGRILALASYTRDDAPFIHDKLFAKSLFPAASVFKTITAAGVIEKAGYTPDTQLKVSGGNHTLYQWQLEKELKNHTTVSLEKAFAYSINPALGRIGLYDLKPNGLREYALKFGFNSEVPFLFPGSKSRFEYPGENLECAEIASGFNQSTTLSPLLGALIAGSIANNGNMMQPVLIDSITDSEHNNVYNLQPRLWRMPIDSSSADKVKRIMSAVTSYGTAQKGFKYIKRSSRFSDIEHGGKTGSVDKDNYGRVDWFIGFARHTTDKDQRVAVGVVTVHGDYWTVHSSYLGAEIMRHYIRSRQDMS
ncbi:MAG: penicillin-binding transpeptidase domain-containing protein [Chitinivibrionales bacterium]